MWALKSRINWMIQSDRNTTFYHMSTLIRRKHNKILNLKDNQGEWITNIHAVMEFVYSSFITLFFTNLVVAPREVPPSEYICPQISETEAQVLNLPVHTNEIKHALWSLKASKAPGSNGLHSGFYQRFWLIVGQLVIKESRRFFKKRGYPQLLIRPLFLLFIRFLGWRQLVTSDQSAFATPCTKSLQKFLWPESGRVWTS